VPTARALRADGWLSVQEWAKGPIVTAIAPENAPGGALDLPRSPVAPRPTTCRMFETPLIERFSRVHPAAPFAFWIPVLAFVGGRAVVVSGGLSAPLGLFAALVVAGFLAWTFVEYVLHRWVFHYLGPKPWQRRFHFIAHGVHHDFPQDATRLVMPLGVSIPLGAIFSTLFYLTLGPTLWGPMFAGFGLGYLAYDGTHYAVHHWKLSSSVGRWLKRHHMLHHHTGLEARYGVSTPLWDVLFGTMGPKTPRE
jgi:dihydroceramide fatty acyl 2-hydroxylase